MVGIAISTTPKRKELFEDTKASIERYMPSGAILSAYSDTEYKGVASSKNTSLRLLYDQGCDHIFLFDDDVYLTKEGFFDWVIQIAKESGYHHFNYMRDIHRPQQRWEYPSGTVVEYGALTGVMLYLTRKVLDKCGGYDSRFKGYGFNHVEYTTRIGYMMQGGRRFLSIEGMEEYLYALDFDGQPKGQTLTKEQKTRHLEANRELIHKKLRTKDFGYCEF